MLVDPPTTGEALPENRRGLVASAFIKIFQEGKGDFNSARKKVDLWDWTQHVLTWHDGRAMSCKRFRYWCLNTLLRRSLRP